MANTDASLSIGADVTGLEAGLKAAQTAVKDSVDKMQGSLKGVGDAFKSVQGYFMAFTAAIAGGTAFKAVIGASNEWAGESGKLAKALGITTEQASVMQVALARTGISSDTLVAASQKMSVQIFKNGTAFQAMGIAVKDSAGQYRPVMTVMTEAATKLKEIKNPIEQNIAGAQLFGKAWSEVKPLMKLTTEQMEASEKRARELHLIVGPEGVALAAQYKAQMRDLGLVGKSLEVQFGQQLTPVFVEFGAAVSASTPLFDGLATVMETIAVLGVNVAYVIQSIGIEIGTIGAGIKAIMTGDFAGAAKIHDDAVKEAERRRKEVDATSARILNARNAKSTPSKAETPDGPTYDFSKVANAKENRIGKWTADLEEEKLTLQEKAQAEGRFYEMSKTDEKAYWQAKLGLTSDSLKDQIAVRQKIAGLGLQIMQEDFAAQIAGYKMGEEAAGHALQAKLAYAQAETRMNAQKYGEQSKQAQEARGNELKIAREIADQKRAIADELANREKISRLMDIDGAEQEAQFLEQLGVITKAQLLQQEQKFAADRYAIDRQALQQKLDLMAADPTSDPAAYEKAKSQLLEIDRKYSQQAGQLSKQLALEVNRPIAAMNQGMESSFANSIQGMLTQAMTLKQGLANIFKQTFEVFMQEMVTKPLAQTAMKILKELGLNKALAAMQGAIYKMLGIEQTTTQAATSTAVAGTKTAEAAVVIPAAAGEAAAGAAQSVASIPYVGPALAAGAFATIMALVMGGMPSAEGGWDIPSGATGIMRYHENEMMLPSGPADTVRSLGGLPEMMDRMQAVLAQASGQGGGHVTHNHYNNVQAWDSRDVGRFFTDNYPHVAKSMKLAVRNGVSFKV